MTVAVNELLMYFETNNNNGKVKAFQAYSLN